MTLPKDGWFQFCVGCNCVTSKFIPDKYYKFKKKSIDNINKKFICLKCQNNKKIIIAIFN